MSGGHTGGDVRTVRAGRRNIGVHRPDKVLFPDREPPLTKADLVGHYRDLAPYMLPGLKGRPLMLERHPDGVGGPRFMQKNTPESYPEWIRRAELPKKGGTVTHAVCDDTATLLYLADQACVTFHRWQSRADRPDRPDRLVFDLDPADGGGFEQVRAAARRLGELLEEIRLPAALMTTGSRGLHVLVPLDRAAGFDEVRAFAGEAADLLTLRDPEHLTTEMRTEARGGRLYLDLQRNAYAQTSVAPYSVRAKPDAPVATPLTWDQLDDPGVHARRWSVGDVLEQARSDPWSHLPARGRGLGPAARRLRALR
ncbi:non-homologous end-joining DNA ligase [Streptomyces sp. NPDC047002]|uniref:non-homologous end-joining DNA ligase n=1 Tax=Streptomyces sp. NPDC047002 TaxID=3155475 RepID=UPI0034517562